MTKIARGFSLVEVLMAMGVLAIGLTATIPLLTYGVQRNALARRAGTAQLLADQVLQRLQLEISTDRNGAPGEAGMLPAQIWSSDTLPHGLNLAIGPILGCAQNQLCCQPADAPFDGVLWNVAFPLRAQGDDYLVCYSVAQQNAVDSRGNAIDGIGGAAQLRAVQVKVLWNRIDGGTSFRTASAFVLGQAALP